MRRALVEAMRARDATAVRALRSALAALDNAEAVPLDDAAARGTAIEASPVGVGAAEAARRDLTDDHVIEIVRAEVEERLHVAASLTAPAQAAHAAELRAEADVLRRFIDDTDPGRLAAETGEH